MRKLAVLIGTVGVGVGVVHADPARTTLEIGTPAIEGGLDADGVAKVVRRITGKLLRCYASTSQEQDTSATATLTVRVSGDGRVLHAAATASSVAGPCISAAIAKLVFDKPTDRRTASVTLELTFERAEAREGAFASLTGTGDIASGFDDKDIYGGLLGDEPGDMNGGWGYGRSGFGPGGGGTGWGTIGTGRYGTIGGKRSAVPGVTIGLATVKGNLDKAIIRRYVKRNILKISYCYEKELLANGKLKGKLTARFTIDPNGVVTASTATGVDPTVAGCVAGVIKAIEFPKPKGGGSVQATYPFTFGR